MTAALSPSSHSHAAASRGAHSAGPARGAGASSAASAAQDTPGNAFAALLQGLADGGAQALASDTAGDATPESPLDSRRDAHKPAHDAHHPQGLVPGQELQAAPAPATQALLPPTDLAAMLALLPQAATRDAGETDRHPQPQHGPSPSPQLAGATRAAVAAGTLTSDAVPQRHAAQAGAASAAKNESEAAMPAIGESDASSAKTPRAGAADKASTPDAAADAQPTPPAHATTFRAALESAAGATSSTVQAASHHRSESESAGAANTLTALHAASGAHFAAPTPDAAQASASAPIHQAALPTRPLDQAFAGDLAAEVNVMMQGGIQSAELHLNPTDLGPIRIQLNLNAQTADLTLQAAHATTREGLEQAVPALREMFAGQGIQLGQASVSSGQQGAAFAFAQREPGQGGNSSQGGNGRSRQGRESSTGGIEGAAPARAPRLQAGRGMLDLYA